MREIKVWINDVSLFQYPHHILKTDIEKYISEWRQVLFQKCKEANADYFIYAVKTINDNGDVDELNIYMTPLNDEEFYKRTEALQKQKDVVIYAWHKGTAY